MLYKNCCFSSEVLGTVGITNASMFILTYRTIELTHEHVFQVIIFGEKTKDHLPSEDGPLVVKTLVDVLIQFYAWE